MSFFEHSPRRPDQWIYFSAGSIVFARVSNPAAFDSENVPRGRGGLCVEVMCHSPDWWAKPDRLSDRVKSDLTGVGLCSVDDFEEIYIEKVRETYPIYTLSYPRERRNILRKAHTIPNFYPAGRCGAFVYNNIG